jgi:hypothetical protein
VVLAVGVVTAPLHAQFFTVPVFDASNFFEDLEQVFDLAQQISNMLFQAQALPVNMLARYHVLLPQWGFNQIPLVFPNPASPILSALNAGDAGGAGYKQVVDPLDVPLDVLARMPLALQRRLLDDYATIQLADSVSALSVDQSGAARTNGNPLLQVLQSMEADAFSSLSSFNTQTALLNKINSASVVGLKEEEQTNQFLSSTLEQLVVDNKRKRDTEAKVMNATINQWRFGASYGQSLFSQTAADIDNWRMR